MDERKNKKLSIRVSEDLHQKLSDEAKGRGVSVSSCIATHLMDYYTGEKTNFLNTPQARQLVLYIAELGNIISNCYKEEDFNFRKEMLSTVRGILDSLDELCERGE